MKRMIFTTVAQKKGFTEVMDTGKMILVYQVKIARRLGYKRAGTLCCRKIKAYLRMANAVQHTGLEIEAAPLNDGLYCITWEAGHII